MKLYEINESFRLLIDLMDNEEVDDEAWCDAFDNVEGELEDKMVGYACVAREFDGNVELLKKEINRLRAIQASYEKRLAYMKSAALNAMKLAGVTKIDKDPRFKIAIRKNGGKLPLIMAEEFPDEFAKFEKKPDNDKIRKALDAGEQLSFAAYGERGETWRY